MEPLKVNDTIVHVFFWKTRADEYRPSKVVKVGRKFLTLDDGSKINKNLQHPYYRSEKDHLDSAQKAQLIQGIRRAFDWSSGHSWGSRLSLEEVLEISKAVQKGVVVG